MSKEVGLGIVLACFIVIAWHTGRAVRNEHAAYARGYAAAVDSVNGRGLPLPKVDSQFWRGFMAADDQLFAWTSAKPYCWPGPSVLDSLLREGYARMGGARP